MNTLLQAENISKRYGNHQALDDVSIAIPKQSIFGLLGPNGAGKTTLIRIINQITGPDSGTVTFDGQTLSPEHISRIGYLPEERGLYKKMKVGEQALYLAQLKGMHRREARKKLKEWFEKFEIGAWWGKKVEELSKGMAQKVQFITTVLHEPELLILDEPFSGFDPINTNLVKAEIRLLREKGATIIFSTHNMGSVEEICDHIALINRSQKILDGSMKQVKKENKDNIWEVLFTGNTLSFTNALWTGFELVKMSDENKDGVIEAKIRLLRNNQPNDLLRTIVNVVNIHAFNEVIPSMNDIFIKKVTEINEAATAAQTPSQP
ncbi:MAG: ABC transporter ATP-binding protein [Salibacteraceae bacterium]